MKTKIEQFSASDPNPVPSAAKDGTVLYSNVGMVKKQLRVFTLGMAL